MVSDNIKWKWVNYVETKELAFNEVQKLKNCKWWTDINNFTKVTRDIRSGFVRMFACVEDKKILATVKVSEKVTVLGRTLASAATQIYGVSISDEVEDEAAVTGVLIPEMFSELKRCGYRSVIAVYADTNEQTRELCRRFGVTERLGSMYMENGKGSLSNYIIVKGDI